MQILTKSRCFCVCAQVEETVYFPNELLANHLGEGMEIEESPEDNDFSNNPPRNTNINKREKSVTPNKKQCSFNKKHKVEKSESEPSVEKEDNKESAQLKQRNKMGEELTSTQLIQTISINQRVTPNILCNNSVKKVSFLNVQQFLSTIMCLYSHI